MEDTIEFRMTPKFIYQVYCSDEVNVNNWLKEHPDTKVVEFKMSLNEFGEMIMVVYQVEIK